MTLATWFALFVALVGAAELVRALRRRAMRHERWRRFFRHRTTSWGLGILVFLVLVALAAPLIAPFDPNKQLDIVHLKNHAPSWTFLLGTDVYSRDVWSRTVYGARVSLGIGALGALVAVSLGTLVGAIAGYYQRWIDAVLMRGVDVGLALPRIFILLMAVALWDGLPFTALVIAIGLTSWFGTSRLVRAEVLSLRQRDFVVAARALGAGSGRVIFRHVLPNAAAPIIVSAALGVGNVLLLEASLSFLGIGIKPPDPTCGQRVEHLHRAVVDTLSGARYFPGRDVVERGRRRRAGRAGSARGRRVTNPDASPPALLRVRDLKTYFVTEHGKGTARAVDDVSFDLYPGETLGIVGESGCGKTVTSLSILRLVPEPPGHVLPGSLIEFEGRNLLALPAPELRAVRGNQIAMIFQEPMTSLNPVFTVGDQIAEAAIIHQHVSRAAARARAIEMLRLVGIPDPDERVDHYPHQLSGGMRHDRDGARLSPQGADCGRADDGARRDHTGADPRASRPPPARAGHGGAADHARPRRGGGPCGPRRRDVCRTRRGDRADGGAV